jgi:octaprenyl-diphosphate synthase
MYNTRIEIRECLLIMSSPGVDAKPVFNLDEARKLVAEDMRAVDTLIQDKLYSEVVLVNQVSNYIIHSGGKRLRPLLVLLCAKCLGCNGSEHRYLAAIVEFIHTATLLHDDVVDGSGLRRGTQTANALWGNEASVLVGDFLYSRAFQMMVELNDMRVMDILADTTNVIAEGEVMQLLNCNNPNTTEAQYLQVIRAKTAQLFEAAGRLPAVINKSPPELEDMMARYALHLGVAFQVVDDALDYCGSATEIGKNVGDDLNEGKPTLPLIYVMNNGSPAQVAIVRRAIEEGGLELLDEVVDAVVSTKAIDYTARAARNEADLALEALGGIPDSPYRGALEALAEFSVSRRF